MTMHCPSNLLGKKKLKLAPQLKEEKIWIPFIQLGIKPTSTPGPRRDQLVDIHKREKKLTCHEYYYGFKW
jgi:hypothetical protein